MKSTFTSLARNIFCISLVLAAVPYAQSIVPAAVPYAQNITRRPVTQQMRQQLRTVQRIQTDPGHAFDDQQILQSYVTALTNNSARIYNTAVATALLEALRKPANATIQNNQQAQDIAIEFIIANTHNDDALIRAYRHVKGCPGWCYNLLCRALGLGANGLGAFIINPEHRNRMWAEIEVYALLFFIFNNVLNQYLPQTDTPTRTTAVRAIVLLAGTHMNNILYPLNRYIVEKGVKAALSGVKRAFNGLSNWIFS